MADNVCTAKQACLMASCTCRRISTCICADLTVVRALKGATSLHLLKYDKFNLAGGSMHSNTSSVRHCKEQNLICATYMYTACDTANKYIMQICTWCTPRSFCHQVKIDMATQAEQVQSSVQAWSKADQACFEANHTSVCSSMSMFFNLFLTLAYSSFISSWCLTLRLTAASCKANA